MKLLVRNLDRATTEADLRALFEPFGAIQSCRLVLDAETGLSKGFGFVEMPKVGDAKAAIQRLNGFAVGGKTIRVKKAEPPAAESPADDGQNESSSSTGDGKPR